jgi:hypothetical protein
LRSKLLFFGDYCMQDVTERYAGRLLFHSTIRTTKQR